MKNSSLFYSTIKYLCNYSQANRLAVFLFKMERDKRKTYIYPENLRATVKLSFWNNSVGDRVCKPVERAANCGDGLL